MRLTAMILFMLTALYGCDSKPFVALSDTLYEAIELDDAGTVRSIVAADPVILNASMVTGMTPLYQALLHRREKVFVELLDLGADPTLRCQGVLVGTIDSPILLGVRRMDIDSVKLMLNGKAEFLITANLLDEVKQEIGAKQREYPTESSEMLEYIEHHHRTQD